MHVYDQTYAIERRLLTRWLSLCKCKLIPDLRRAYGIDACIDDPTRASFVFAHSLALSDTSHEVQIFLTADATCLTRKATSDAVIYLLASIFVSLRLTQLPDASGLTTNQAGGVESDGIRSRFLAIQATAVGRSFQKVFA